MIYLTKKDTNIFQRFKQKAKDPEVRMERKKNKNE